MTSLSEWLHRLEHRYPQEIKLGLSRIRQMAQTLGVYPHPKTKVITVGGTNGKGSTVAALESIYCTAGYKVAVYTSPHLLTFNERIRFQQQPIQDAVLCGAFEIIEDKRGQVPLTYFETVTLAALWYFKSHAPDVMILEVGMGGRRDATNIIDSDLAIITTVALDHQAYLGLTRAAIGYQKAGILRAHKPFIYADDDPPSSVVSEGIRLKAPMIQSSLHFEVKGGSFQFSRTPDGMLEFPVPKLHPKAVAAALMASAELQALLPVTKNAKIASMQTVALMGRQHFEIHQGVPTLLDVAHNEQAVLCLSEKIQALETPGKVRAVFSALKDKDLHGLIRGLSSLVDVWYLAELEGKRSSSESVLQEAFYEVLSIRPTCFKDPKQAYAQALKDAQMGDLVVVYGSFLTVGPVLSQIYCQ